MLEGVEVAERQIISFLVRNPEDAYQVSEDDFLSSTAKDLYRSITGLLEQNTPLTPQTLAVQLSLRNGRGVLDTQLVPFWNPSESDEAIGYFRKELARAVALDMAKKTILTPLVNEGMNQQSFDMGIYDETEEKIRQLRENWADSRSIVLTGRQATDLYRETLDDRAQHRSFRTSGCSYLDRHITMGFAPGTISTIFGPTGSGKTTLALSYFMKQVNKGVPAAYFSLEMTLDALMDRLFAMRSEINISALYPHMNDSGEIAKNVLDKFELFAESFSKCPNVRLIEPSVVDMRDISKYVGEIKRSMGVDYLSVYIDLFSMLKEFTGEGRASTADKIEACMNLEHSVAKQHGVHFINVVQANRDTDSHRPSELEDIHKLRPRLRNIKSSNAIAERSRVVIGVFRPKPYAQEFFPDAPETTEMVDVLHAIILKQNQGALGELQYAFNGAQSRVTKFTPPDETIQAQQQDVEAHLALARQDLVDLGLTKDPDDVDEEI